MKHLVEHPGVKSGVHPLARASCGEAAATPHHHVEHAEGDEVGVLVANTLKTFQMKECSFGHQSTLAGDLSQCGPALA